MTKFQWRYLSPHPTFWQVRRGYLLYHGNYYPIERMPSNLFRTIIREVHPDFAISKVFHQKSYDLVDKWHILQKYRMKLYYLRNGVFCDR